MTDRDKLAAIRRLIEPRHMTYDRLFATIAHIIEHGEEPFITSNLIDNDGGVRVDAKQRGARK